MGQQEKGKRKYVKVLKVQSSSLCFYNVLAFGIRDLCDVFVPEARVVFFKKINDLIRGVVMTNVGGVKGPS